MRNKESFQELWISAAQNMRIKKCMYPGCTSEEPIKSHALQNNGIISKLAQGGHVLMPVTQRGILFPNKDKQIYQELKSVGKNQATVFYGFCKKHDPELFYPIENTELTLNNYNCFLFAYRCACAQLRNKEEYIRRMDLLSEDKEYMKEYNNVNPYYVWCKYAIRDIRRAKSIMDSFIRNGKKNPVNTLIWKLGKIKFASEGIIQPYTDFTGNEVGGIYDKLNYPLFITVFPYKDTSIALISWLKVDKQRLRRYISYLRKLTLKEQQFYLTNAVLKSSDDLVICPEVGQKIKRSNLAPLFEGAQNMLQDETEYRFHNASIMLQNWGINLFDL